MARRYQGKFGALQIRDAACYPLAGEDAYGHVFTVGFEQMDLRAPEGRPRPAEIPVLDRGNLTSTTHYVQGSDVAVVQQQRLAFAADLDDAVNTSALRTALCNPDRNDPWVVSGFTFSPVAGNRGILNGSGTSVATPVPFDMLQDRVDIWVLFYGTGSGKSQGRVYRDCWFPFDLQQLEELPDAVHLNATGWCFGQVSVISVFPGVVAWCETWEYPASSFGLQYTETWES